MAVDLNPSSGRKEHPIAMYTYDAGGERIIKYLKKQLDFTVNASEYNSEYKEETFLYPSGRITAKVLEYKNARKPNLKSSLAYTKHYYIGGKRYASKIGTLNGLGLKRREVSNFIVAANAENIDLVELLKGKSDNDSEAFEKIEKRIGRIYKAFGLVNIYCSDCTEIQKKAMGKFSHELTDIGHVEQFYFHGDHLGSSNYITNYDGNITQHSEYLPFGELLVDEHRNSHNTRYKFNGKEFDQETGNYYYGARYYDPKTSLWLSVDPLADHSNQVDKSPYAAFWNNPVKFTDPDGKCPDCPDEVYVPISKHVYTAKKGDVTENGWEVVREVDLNEESGFRGALYKGKYKGKTEYIYATAGTQDMLDGVEDAKQLIGDSKQYSQSVGFAQQYSKNYEGVSFTGHSLGGGLASANALKVEGKAVTFNAAGLSNVTRKGLELSGNTANISAYIVRGEAVDYYQSKIGLKAEGNINYLPATYVPEIPFTKIEDRYRTLQRVGNHLMNTVIQKFNENK